MKQANTSIVKATKMKTNQLNFPWNYYQKNVSQQVDKHFQTHLFTKMIKVYVNTKQNPDSITESPIFSVYRESVHNTDPVTLALQHTRGYLLSIEFQGTVRCPGLNCYRQQSISTLPRAVPKTCSQALLKRTIFRTRPSCQKFFRKLNKLKLLTPDLKFSNELPLI